MMTKKKEYLQEMGVDIWQSKTQQKEVSGGVGVNASGLEEVRGRVAVCTLCELHKTRTNTVFGIGNERANAMFIGEAPGANEDLQGEPFVGKAGMLLNSMIQAIGLKRSDVYIANILKCRPPENRAPMPQEVKLCTPYLQQQITLIQPKILIAVGRIAAQFLLNTSEPMSRLRGQVYQYGAQNTPLLVTYHPAYLLRAPTEKTKAYVDFLMIKRALTAC